MTKLSETDLPDAQILYDQLLEAARKIIAPLPAGKVHLVGIHSGGAWLAQQLHRDLGLESALGTLNISFYRDDFDRIGLHSQTAPSDISFEVNQAHLILIDDVLYTGRTIRAAMNELFDYGRPASIQLLVLVDRGERQLPVQADFAAWKMPAPASGSLVLQRSDEGQFSLILEQEAE